MDSKRLHGIQGMTFGSMDAIIMVLGIVVGLGVMGNRTAVFVGILVAGIANSFGNAWGFHISEETENIHSRREVWLSTVMSFSGTLVSTIILLIPVLFLPLTQAIMASVVIGVILVFLIGLAVSRIQGLGRAGCCKVILEYVSISLLVITIAYYLGQFASGLVL
jgi:VIT1/CCC1 family predicted Fe2+/Mn2+ transporter